jgi:hypothetical protein
MCQLMEWKSPTWSSVGNTRRGATLVRHIWVESWSFMQVFYLYTHSTNLPLTFYFGVLSTLMLMLYLRSVSQRWVFDSLIASAI